VNEARQRRRIQREVEVLRQRLAGRRDMTRAVVHLMRLCGIDEDAAYAWLRDEAMRRRIPIEDMARESLGRDRQTTTACRQPESFRTDEGQPHHQQESGRL
jgi:AmiR/NasT family two-component response regulator